VADYAEDSRTKYSNPSLRGRDNDPNPLRADRVYSIYDASVDTPKEVATSTNALGVDAAGDQIHVIAGFDAVQTSALKIGHRFFRQAPCEFKRSAILWWRKGR